uniref:DNA mismatch repair protein MutS n=1 Tax=Lygus hesperus TaxID=30085 RepID=A0A0A9YGF6_LYGHE
MIKCLMAMVLGAITCGARVYTPCELAHYFRYYYSSYIPEKYVPLAVCIAGYHNYSKSNELVHPDGRIFVGYFGLIAKPECPEDRLKDDSYFSADWSCLKSQVLDVPEKLKLYEKLCGDKLVKKLTCRFNEYFEFGEVLDPIHKDILSLSYGEESVIDNILDSYRAKDQQAIASSTFKELQNNTTLSNPILPTTRELQRIPTESQLINNPAFPESTNDMTRSYYIQEFTRKSTLLPELKHFQTEDDRFCFDKTQVSLICTLLLVQTLLITALIYILTKYWKTRKSYCQASELKLFPLPSSPPMEEFSRKPYSAGSSG